METQDKPFEIRTYGFSELAMLYFPNSSKECAAVQLRRWIKHSVELQNSLSEAGYRANIKIFTPKQVSVIVNYLGVP